MEIHNISQKIVPYSKRILKEIDFLRVYKLLAIFLTKMPGKDMIRIDSLH